MATIKTEDPSTWRLSLTPSSGGSAIPYKLVSRSGNFGLEDISAAEEYIIQSENLIRFVREFFPTADPSGMPIYTFRAMAGLLIRVSNIRWEPLVDGVPIDPFGADSSAPAGTYHPLTKVIVEYSDSAEDTAGGGNADPNSPLTFLSINCRSAGEFIYLPSAGSKWELASGAQVDNKEQNNPVTKVVPMLEWSITWPYVIREYYYSTLEPRLREAQGKINNAAYALLGNAPAETLLLASWDVQDDRSLVFPSDIAQDPVGNLQYQAVRITVNILEKAVKEGSNVYGHNHFYSRDNGWAKFRYSQTNELAYETHDFDQLFAV